jgi:hypothetical protein
MRLSLIALIPISVLTLGCGSSPAGPDGGADLTGPLIGTWRSGSTTYVFKSDATFTMTTPAPGPSASGTFSVTAGHLVLDGMEPGGANRARIDQTYVVTGPKLCLTALLRTSGQSIIGNWLHTTELKKLASDGSVTDTRKISVSYQVHADLTVTARDEREATPDLLGGKVTAVDATHFLFSFGPPLHEELDELLDDQALCPTVFMRVP